MKFYSISILFLTLFIVSLSACEGDENGNSSWDGVCTSDRDGWKKCEGNRIQWCHVLAGMDPHFHEGQNCEASGLTCKELKSESDSSFEAFCVDESKTCNSGEFDCVDNTAQNCIDGVMALEPCGTKKCHKEGKAICEKETEECGGYGHLHDGKCDCEGNYKIDPNDDKNCVASHSFPELACKIFQDNKDAIPSDHHLDATDEKPGPHAHLNEVMEAHLVAANTTNYFHFPVLKTGEYVIFLDTTGVVQKFYDKEGNELSFTNPGPNGKCTDLLVDHFHISATYTGDGSSPVPAIVELSVTKDTEIKFLVMFHEEEH